MAELGTPGPYGRPWAIVVALVASLLMAACAEPEQRAEDTEAWASLRISGQHALPSTAVRIHPETALVDMRLGPERALYLRLRRFPVTVHLPGFCPTVISRPGPHPHAAKPLLDLPRSLSQVGFDAAVRVHLQRGCDAAPREVAWRQIAGPRVVFRTQDRGLELRFQSASMPAAILARTPHGLVPVSASEQRSVTFEASYLDSAGIGHSQRTSITPMARATGLPTLAVGQQVLLAGPQWQLVKKPPLSHAKLNQKQKLTTFQADVRGRYYLRDADGCTLTIHAARHSEIPMDCGRAGCHEAISAHATHSPMSRALTHLPVDGNGESAGCVPDCHFSGQAGLDDGGFLATARELGFQPLLPQRYAQLPVPLQRLGAVRCMDCHGPAAIPPENGRADILQTAVCATCHDFSPAVDHVARWRASSMASADRNPATQRDSACASCHTTAGFLDRIGVRTLRPVAGPYRPTGISCAACHAPHGAHGPRLIRQVRWNETLHHVRVTQPVNQLCASCHAPLKSDVLPSASAAVLVLGTIHSAVLGDQALQQPAVHAALPQGCSACHGHRSGLEMDHAFRPSRESCAGCHEASVFERTKAAQNALEQRANSLWMDIRGACDDSDTFAAHGAAPSPTARCEDFALQRAAYMTALVLRDRGAAAHNLPFAHYLLDQASVGLSTLAE